jgi:hypothetical protein
MSFAADSPRSRAAIAANRSWYIAPADDRIVSAHDDPEPLPQLPTLRLAITQGTHRTLGLAARSIPVRVFSACGCAVADCVCVVCFCVTCAVAGSMAGCWALARLSRMLCGRFLPSYRALDRPTRRMFDLYVVSTANAVLLGPWSAYKLLGGLRSTDGCWRALLHMASYLLSDLMALLTNGLLKPDMAVHHGFGLVLGLFPVVMRRYLRFHPGFLQAELSTIPLNVLWFARTFGLEIGGWVRASKWSFAALFAACRLVVFPWLFVHMRAATPPAEWESTRMKVARGGVLTLIALQFWWGVLIVRKLMSDG